MLPSYNLESSHNLLPPGFPTDLTHPHLTPTQSPTSTQSTRYRHASTLIYLCSPRTHRFRHLGPRQHEPQTAGCLFRPQRRDPHGSVFTCLVSVRSVTSEGVARRRVRTALSIAATAAAARFSALADRSKRSLFAPASLVRLCAIADFSPPLLA